MWQVVLFATLLCMWQQVLGTTTIFTLCSFLFVVFAGLAFNVGGGLTRVAGTFAFGYSIMAVIIGLVFKNIAGEPGQKNLLQPERTIEVFLGGMTAILLASLLTRRLRLKRSLFDRMPFTKGMKRTAMASAVVGSMYFVFSFSGYVTKPEASFPFCY